MPIYGSDNYKDRAKRDLPAVLWRDMIAETEAQFKARAEKHAAKYPDCWMRWYSKTKEIKHYKV